VAAFLTRAQRNWLGEDPASENLVTLFVVGKNSSATLGLLARTSTLQQDCGVDHATVPSSDTTKRAVLASGIATQSCSGLQA